SLAELKGRQRRGLGAEAGSIADYRLAQRGSRGRLYRNHFAALRGLADGDVDFAYLWANVGWALHASPELAAKLVIVPGLEPEDRWDIAGALRNGDVELKRRVDEAIGALLDDGTVARTLHRYYMPAATSRKEARHATARQPDMRRDQTSKRPYDAMARVRWAGVLVVGLDQNSLPFSSAHPSPAGLD